MMLSLSGENKFEKYCHWVTLFIVGVCFAWAIMPMAILRENYVFTIFDGMDSYGGTVQNIHKNGLFFHMNQAMPFMNGLHGKYTFLTFTLYDFYNCMFGYVNGQILTRITGMVLGFLFTKRLLEMLSPPKNAFQADMIKLLAMAYIITPVAPNRMIGFATLPAIIILFLELEKREKLTKYIWISLLVPVFSIFDTILVFCLGFWFVAAIVAQWRKKRLNWNLNISFLVQCVVTIIVNWTFFAVALQAGDTNRSLSVDQRTEFLFDFDLFVNYLLNGQIHSSPLHREILMPFLAIGTIYVLFLVFVRKEKANRSVLYLVFAMWGMWILSAFIITAQECGFKTGFLLVDGFQWGRIIGFMRLGWYIIFACVLFITDRKTIWRTVLYGVVCLQLVYVATTHSTYNDTLDSVKHYKQTVINNNPKYYITYNDFYAPELFDEIKEDLVYNGEGVAAYGYHPAVLMNNCFNTVDGYQSVHSMEWQLQFREIIAPALDRYDDFRQYYDGWGGRMYLFGELPYNPTKKKTTEEYPLYIDVEAFKKYGGKYILSRAQISNAEEIGLDYINDYNRETSIYHIWVYEAR